MCAHACVRTPMRAWACRFTHTKRKQRTAVTNAFPTKRHRWEEANGRLLRPLEICFVSYYVYACVFLCGYVPMSAGPAEARGIRSSGGEIAWRCEPPDMGVD